MSGTTTTMEENKSKNRSQRPQPQPTTCEELRLQPWRLSAADKVDYVINVISLEVPRRISGHASKFDGLPSFPLMKLPVLSAFERARNLAPLPKGAPHSDPHLSDEGCMSSLMSSRIVHMVGRITCRLHDPQYTCHGHSFWCIAGAEPRAIKSTVHTLGVCHYDTAVR